MPQARCYEYFPSLQFNVSGEDRNLQSSKRWSVCKRKPTRLMPSPTNSDPTTRRSLEIWKTTTMSSPSFLWSWIPCQFWWLLHWGRPHNHLFSAPTADTPSIIDTKANSELIGVGTPEMVNNPSIGGGGPDVNVRPRADLTRSNVGGAMTFPVLGGREARRLEWTAAGPTGTAEGRTHGDVCRLHRPQRWYFCRRSRSGNCA